MSAPAFSLCVYCGSREGADPRFADAARAVGQWIGQSGGQLVYGGGRAGLMGMVSDATQAAGGRVIGVIPQTLVDREAANQRCDELHVVSTMHERKAMLAERSDAFLALPGGIGTFEELFEAWTWRHLGYHDKPMGLLNIAGYYDDLLSFLGKTVEAGFMTDGTARLLQVDTRPEPLLARLIEGLRHSAGDNFPPRSVI
ncbi:TIGR00730 family Rossman fold protein [Xylophilus rhododendri]|uniref:Cytokinin riboside 5'-monophosphate phosphoribohydrolase n=1 Tax=Xylophilus rhododendri TaxID=2697032 RepID=A0A857J1S5_9BURK|nr:TIGR00730 family Rossman fold protein [Xylophilus rhododendri]QHI96908.1 TIGR00730 family Rossman fold protein [Xylophilus rhododendri]